MKNRFNSIFIIVISLYIFIFNIFSAFAEQQKRYVPYPILFVSGIGTATSGNHYPLDTWVFLISEYLKYYDKYVIEEMIGNYDLSYGEEVYLEFLAYDGNQSIETNASILLAEINRILTKYYPSGYTYVAPCETPKVILVTHSMGGLISRKMLQKYGAEAKNKVAQIFFLGTPHLGSPLANIISFLPEENDELLRRIQGLDKVIKKHIKGDKSEAISLRKKLESKLNGNKIVIDILKSQRNIVATGAAIENMRIPFANANLYSHYFVSANRILGWNLPLDYTPETTFLANLGTTNPEVPSTSIAGTDVYLRDIIYDLFRYGPKIGALSYAFEPNDYSCVKNGYYNDGDGVVNRASQTAVGASSVFVSTAHSSTWSDEHIGEYDSPITRDIILQAIDDAPVIENVVLSLNLFDMRSPYNYVTVKVKDYFLADIEIAELTINGNPVDLSEFYDPRTHTYKPYFKYEKDFLKERDGLGPGEFTVKINEVSTGDKIYIKIKNPAKREASCVIYLVSPEIKSEKKGGGATGKYYSCLQTDGDFYESNAYPSTWSQTKEAAYNDFLNSDYTTVNFGEARILASIFQSGGSYYWYSGTQGDGDFVVSGHWSAFISLYDKAQFNFNLDIGARRIKSIKFKGVFYKWLKGSATDYNLFVHNGNELLFTLNTASFNIGPDPRSLPPMPLTVGTPFEVNIDKTKMDLNGTNTLELTSDITEDNCIPNPPFPPNGEETYARYEQLVYILNPSLVVIFEEDGS